MRNTCLMMISAGVLALSPASAAAGYAQSHATTQQDRIDFEAGLRNSPSGAMFSTAQRLFPQEYDKLIRTLMSELNRHPAADDSYAKAIEKPLLQFFEKKQKQAMRAPTSSILAINQAAMVFNNKIKRESVHACATYSVDGAFNAEDISDEVKSASAEVKIRILEAAKAAQGAGSVPPRGTPSDEEFLMLIEKMHAMHVDPKVIALFEEEGALEKAGERELCGMTVAMHEAIAQLPPELSAKFVSDLVLDPDPD